MKQELKRSTVKPFMMGCLITAFMVSLGVNYLFYTGKFTNVPMTDEQRLNNELAGLYE